MTANPEPPDGHDPLAAVRLLAAGDTATRVDAPLPHPPGSGVPAAEDEALAARLDADRRLVEAVLAGHAGAFEQLVREHQGLCWHVVQRMVRHPEDTRELCQEAFLRVHRYLHQWRGERALKSWIAQVAYSVAKRHLEKKRIPIAEAGGDNDVALLDGVAGEADVESEALSGDAQARLHAAIERLPPLQRTLLTLHHLDELPIPEISRVTGITANTIKSHLFRARKALRRVLDPVMEVAA